jgi:hypothetical protein
VPVVVGPSYRSVTVAYSGILVQMGHLAVRVTVSKKVEPFDSQSSVTVRVWVMTVVMGAGCEVTPGLLPWWGTVTETPGAEVVPELWPEVTVALLGWLKVLDVTELVGPGVLLVETVEEADVEEADVEVDVGPETARRRSWTNSAAMLLYLSK